MSDTPTPDKVKFWQDMAGSLAEKLTDAERERDEARNERDERTCNYETCLTVLRAENTRLQMELDASCNAEELRQVRADLSTLQRESAGFKSALKEALIPLAVITLTDSRKPYKEIGTELRDGLLKAHDAVFAALSATNLPALEK